MNNIPNPQAQSGINLWFIAKWVLILGLIILGVKFFYDARKERISNYTGVTPPQPVKLQVKKGRKKKKKKSSTSPPPVPNYKNVSATNSVNNNNKKPKQNKSNVR